jgi:hypothetical protein
MLRKRRPQDRPLKDHIDSYKTTVGLLPVGRVRHSKNYQRIGAKRASNIILPDRMGYVRGLAPRRLAQILPLRPRDTAGAPVPFESSALSWVTIPSDDVVTLILQNRVSSEI